jgi:hypothetical protein
VVDLSRLMGKMKGIFEEQWFLLQALTMKDGLLSLLCTHAVCAGSAQKMAIHFGER